MNLFEKLLLEFRKKIDRETMTEFANYKLSDGGVMGKEASFLLWGESRKDTTIFWEESTWEKIKPEFIVLGMNQSKYIDSNFGIFHKEVAGDMLKEISQVTKSMEGAIVLDLIKLKREHVKQALKNPEAINKIRKNSNLNLKKIREQEDDDNGIFLAPNSALVEIVWEYSSDLKEYTKKMLKEKIAIIQKVFGLSDPPTISGALGKITSKAASDIGFDVRRSYHPSGGRKVGKSALVKSFSFMGSAAIIKRILTAKNFDNDDVLNIDPENVDLEEFQKIKSQLQYALNMLDKIKKINNEIESDARPWPGPGPERVERLKEKKNLLYRKSNYENNLHLVQNLLRNDYGMGGIILNIYSVNSMLFNILQFEEEHGDLDLVQKKVIDPFSAYG